MFNQHLSKFVSPEGEPRAHFDGHAIPWRPIGEDEDWLVSLGEATSRLPLFPDGNTFYHHRSVLHRYKVTHQEFLINLVHGKPLNAMRQEIAQEMCSRLDVKTLLSVSIEQVRALMAEDTAELFDKQIDLAFSAAMQFRVAMFGTVKGFQRLQLIAPARLAQTDTVRLEFDRLRLLVASDLAEPIWRFLSPLPPDASQAGPRDTNAMRKENEAIRYFKARFADIDPPTVKREFFQELDRTFPKLSKRARGRIWDMTAPSHLRRAGRKPKT